MTGRHTRFIVLTGLAIAVVSAAVYAQVDIADLRARAEQGNALAQFNLGVNYTSGEGVPQDDVEATRWFRLAAEQGHLGAQQFLGAKYWIGKGVPQDYVQSHMWLHLAASRLTGEDLEKAVEARASVAQMMTPTQIAEAQRLAREWESRQRQPSETQEEVAPSNSPNTLSDELGEAVKGIVERMATDPESSVTTKEVQTASAFLGYYFRHTRGTARYCEGLSVNVDEFVAEFTEQHSAEIKKATASLARHGMNPETLWQGLASGILDLVAQEFEDKIEKLPVSSPRELCAAYNANAEFLVTGMHFSLLAPPAHKLLMSGPG